MTASDITELQYGLKALKGTLARAAQLCGALELDTDKRGELAEQYKQLNEKLEGSGGYAVADDEIYAARIATRLRYGQLRKLAALDKKRGVQPNPDVETKMARLLEIGRTFGIQLDLIDQSDESDEDEEGGESEDLGEGMEREGDE